MSDSEHSFAVDLPLHCVNAVELKCKRHRTLCRVLGIEARLTRRIFVLAAGLCDPFTQPEENDDAILSLDTLSDVLIALSFQQTFPSSDSESEGEGESPTPHFDLAYHFMALLEQIHFKLNCYDDAFLRSIDNGAAHERANLRLWTLLGVCSTDLALLYAVTCVTTLAIHKLYAATDNIFLNPFLGYLLKLWKCHTNIVVLGLDVDRRDEAAGGPGTPESVRAAVHGSAAVRAVVASILNGDIKKALVHDFEHETLLSFMNPLGRKLASGSLTCDIRWYVTAMLSLGADLVEVTELLYDMEPNDVYDEDVKYMFDIEYEDESDDDGYEPPRRCDCEFDYDYFEEEPVPADKPAPTAVRSRAGELDYDEDGRDWRDIPRGENMQFNPTLARGDVMSWSEITAAFTHMADRVVSDTLGQKAIRTVAGSVKHEFDEQIQLAALGPAARDAFERARVPDPEVVTPDKIYDVWSVGAQFEPILRLNPAVASCMMDEMLMAHGYRRVLIWFLTHLEVSHALINYIHELITGQRGAVPLNRYQFSRLGALTLSDVERNMLLHEFLSNAATYLTAMPETRADNDARAWNRFHTRGAAKRLMEILCLMVESLVNKGVLSITDPEYRAELQTLLIQWVGLLPHARNLFFRTRGGEPDDDLLANFDAVHSQLVGSTQQTLEEGVRRLMDVKTDSTGSQTDLARTSVYSDPARSQTLTRAVSSACATIDNIDTLCSKMINGLPDEFSEELLDFLTQFKALSGTIPDDAAGAMDRIEDWVKPQDLQKLEQLLERASKISREGLEARILELDSSASMWTVHRDDSSHSEGEGEFAQVIAGVKKKPKKKKPKKKKK
ncbi:hypothetical protein BABINDRAFT_161635 [Babjeviella inositovora NRRL Y-12698]|uniref:Uncharacterized protein n=1 Tax=Babjeviella inositovora NRRL Y-12698 TaxID=984486 RepID=A0A1E3QQM2_9ASCO|nr:uncharacterized protein BABINDRAFT_161635 [Babjeviella inositovora NRRL Y-12698]ODQ79981.1 hypothetical protein BABINDRAFT_161635 [Babjeviella inositovora NRRL Y-12698]